MYLSGLVERRRFCVVPTLVTLVVSWCLLLCGSLAHAEPATQASNTEARMSVVVEHGEEPPCHQHKDTTTEPPFQSQDQDHEHDSAEECDTCDAPPGQAGQGNSTQTISLLVNWFGFLLATADPNPLALGPDPTPSPPPAHRLHLIKSVFLI